MAVALEKKELEPHLLTTTPDQELEQSTLNPELLELFLLPERQLMTLSHLELSVRPLKS